MTSAMTETLRVAAVQLQSGADLSTNLDQAGKQVRLAAEAGARLVLLPENFAYLGPESGKVGFAEELGGGGPIQDRMGSLASSLGLYLVAGGMPETSSVPARPYNTSVVFDPAGEPIARYRKVHLFDADLPGGQQLRESASTSAGGDVSVVDIDGFRVGLTICYDLRFGELFQLLSGAGAEILTVPAAFTEQTGRDHWHVLLRARAIEWQCWVAAAGQWGQHSPNRRSFGHSLLVDPWGRVTAECADGVGFCISDFTKDLLEDVRQRLPRLKHGRLNAASSVNTS